MQFTDKISSCTSQHSPSLCAIIISAISLWLDCCAEQIFSFLPVFDQLAEVNTYCLWMAITRLGFSQLINLWCSRNF